MENASDPSVIADGIHTAATDSTDRLRYAAGADAVEIIGHRAASDDPAFCAAMKARFAAGLWVSVEGQTDHHE